MEHQLIKNADELIAIYGSWPAFHDAEVLSVELRRAATVGDHAEPPSLELVIADRDGPTSSQWLVKLRFSGIREVVLEDFNQQNVLFDIELTPLTEEEDQPGWKTVCNTSHGLSGAWESDAIEVVAVTPLG